MKTWQFSALVILGALLVSTTNGNACGGVFTSNSGEFTLPKARGNNGDLQCVWILQLLSRQTINFTLNGLDSNGIVTLYPELHVHEGALTYTRLSATNVGQPTTFEGQTLVVILTRTDYSAGLSFTWDSVAAASRDVLKAVNYADSDGGHLLWNKFDRQEQATWALNLDSSLSVGLKAVTEFARCDQPNPCECTYFGLYEITDEGYLYEVTRVCGRSSSFETTELYPKLVAFIYINSTLSLDDGSHVELTWSADTAEVTEAPEPVSTTTEDDFSTIPPPTTTTEGTTVPAPGIISLGCGGLIDMPPKGSTIKVEYKYQQEYSNNERCFWTLNDNQYDGVQRALQINVTLLAHGFEFNRDGLAFVWWDNDGMGSRLLERNKSYVPMETYPRHYLSFTSDSSVTGQGFLAEIGVMSISSNITGENWFSSEPSRYNHSTVNPRSLDRVSLVVSPPRDTTYIYNVDYIDMYDTAPACNVDNLKIYEIFDLGKYSETARLCGNVSQPLQFFAKSPILVHFAAFGSYNASFGTSWFEL